MIFAQGFDSPDHRSDVEPQVLKSISPALPRPILPGSDLVGLCAFASDQVAAAVILTSPCVVAKACPHMSASAIGAQMP